MQLEENSTKSIRVIDNKNRQWFIHLCTCVYQHVPTAVAVGATFKYLLTLLQHKGWSTPQMCRWTCWSSLWPSAASAAAHPGIFDAHCQSTHRYHYLPRRDNQRHSCIMKQSTHNPPGANRNRVCLSANFPMWKYQLGKWCVFQGWSIG